MSYATFRVHPAIAASPRTAADRSLMHYRSLSTAGERPLTDDE